MHSWQLYTLVSILLTLTTHAQAWDCTVTISKSKWDLTSLNVEKTVSRTRVTPPSSFEDQVLFNICGELKERGGIDKDDQCTTGTLACLTEVNRKQTDGVDRITRVIPLATSADLDLKPRLASTSPDKGLILTFHGPSWPPSATPSTPQAFNVSLLCASSDSDPKFINYDFATGVLDLEWSVKAACPKELEGGGNDTGSGDDKKSPQDSQPAPSGGGVGYFFTLLFLAFGAYLGLGAYWNYNQYGATGWDLIPHRDFWREVPYLFQDLISHLFSSFRPGGSRSGYVSV